MRLSRRERGLVVAMSSCRVGGRVAIDRHALENTPLYARFPNAAAANGHVNFKRTRGSHGGFS